MATIEGFHSVAFMVTDDKVTDDPEGHTELLATVVEQALHERFPRLMVARLEGGDVLVRSGLLDALVDGDACWFDHHGGCQAHGYLSLEQGEKCPQFELKERLGIEAKVRD